MPASSIRPPRIAHWVGMPTTDGITIGTPRAIATLVTSRACLPF